MAVFPNTIALNFSNWILITPWLEATNPQLNLVTQVRDAAAISGSVSEHTWNEYLRITGLWYKYYQAFIDQTTAGLNQWIDFSASCVVVGFSSLIVKQISYTRINNVLYINFIFFGTSNATTLTFTIPTISSTAVFGNYGLLRAGDNSVSLAAAGMWSNTSGTSSISCFKDTLQQGFTASGIKFVSGQLFIPV